MKTFFLLLAFFICCFSYSQVSVDQEISEYIEDEEDTIIEDIQEYDPDEFLELDSILVVPEAWETNFDSLLNSWHVMHYTNKLNHSGYADIVPTSDSAYIERLSKLPNIIELPYNSTVKNYINIYVERKRDLVEYMLGLEALYFPIIEEILDKYELPLELKYLVIIESALNPVALSTAGASGLWQFMIGTGKIYGLEINSLIDERRDPYKATDAACRHLKDLYNTYGDWNLAIAAYNCGAGNVNKAIKRAGGKKDYWAISQYLPRETRLYIPSFIAANYVMNYYAHHQLYPVQISLPLVTDTVMVDQMIHFDQITEVLQIDKEMIRALNPQYKRDMIPGNYKPQVLKLPATQIYSYVEKEDEIMAHRVDELFTNRLYVDRTSAPSRTQKITHKVVGGETVLIIADKYGVTAANVRRWNNLSSGANRLGVGRNLTLNVDNGGYAFNNTATTKAASTPASTPSTAARNNTSSSKIDFSKVDTVQYKVKEGDSYYTIAQKYPGFSSSDLMKLNNRTTSSLRAGQYIKVPKI